MATPNWIKTSGLLQIGDSFERTETVAGWTENFYSPDGITGDCEIAFNAQSVSHSYMMGIDLVSGAPTGSADIDYSLKMDSNGTLACFNGSTYLATSANAEQGTEVNLGEWFRLVYDSTAGKIYFYRGYRLFHTQSGVGSSLTFYPKGQFQNYGAKLWYASHRAVSALDAPTDARYDLGTYEFDFTKNPIVVIGGHEFTLDSGLNWNPCTSETIALGSAYREPNTVKVRVTGSTDELVCLSAYPNPTPPPTGTTDTTIFFLGGQSQVLKDTDSTEPVIPAGKALIYQDLDLVDYNNKVSKSEISTQFLKDKYENDKDQPHIIIGRYAVGGTGILNNLVTFVGNDNTNEKIRDWSVVGDIRAEFAINYNNLLMKIENDGVYNVLENNIIWLLGEQDSNLLSPQYSVYDASYYEDRYNELITYFSDEFNLDNLYISAVGRDVDGLSDDGREIVETTQLSVGVNNTNAEVFTNIAKTFVDTGQMSDNVHYNDSGRQSIGTALFNYIPYVPFAPVITEEDNDTNTFAYTPTTGVEMRIKGGSWFDQDSPYDVGNINLAIGDIEIKVKAEGVNPESDITASTSAYTFSSLNIQNDLGTTADANSYIDGEYYVDYWAKRGVTIAFSTDAEKAQVEGALIQATSYIDTSNAYCGDKLNRRDQLTVFPRSPLYDNGGYSVEGVPREIKEAQCEYANIYTEQGTLQPNQNINGAVKRTKEKVDVIEEEVEYVGSGQTGGKVAYPTADNKIPKSFICSGSDGYFTKA